MTIKNSTMKSLFAYNTTEREILNNFKLNDVKIDNFMNAFNITSIDEIKSFLNNPENAFIIGFWSCSDLVFPVPFSYSLPRTPAECGERFFSTKYYTE